MAQINFFKTPDFLVEKRISKKHMPEMHHHQSYEIFYIIKGEREYFIEDKFFSLETGDLVIVPKGLLHRTTGGEASRFLINFSESCLERFFKAEAISSLAIDKPFVFRIEKTKKDFLLNLFNTLFEEYNKQREENPEENPKLVGYLYQILFTITFDCNTYVSEEYTDAGIGGIVRYINENYTNINGIEEIAERFYMSKYHLCRLFVKNLGVGLITYLNNIKIRQACKMIREGKGSITEIALAAGFNSASYFCKVFKSEMSVSPLEYKRLYAAEDVKITK
jgi:AraC-like DNA-binding protein